MIRFSGRLRSCAIIGAQGIRARKLRTLLSLVSLFLGVLAVVVVQAGAEIAQGITLSQSMLERGRDGTWEVYLPQGADTIVRETVRGRPDAVGYRTMQATIGEPGVEPINPGGGSFDGSSGGMGYNGSGHSIECAGDRCWVIGTDSGAAGAPKGRAIELQLTAVTGDLRQFRPFPLKSGRWLEFNSEPSMSPRIVLNEEAAKGFAQYGVPAEMRLQGARANPTPRIVGVVHDGNSAPNAYVRDDELANWVTEAGGPSMRSESLRVLLAPTAQEVRRILKARLVASGFKAEEMSVNKIDAAKDAGSGLAIMRWIFLGMASLVLLIGVAGVLNVGLATVGERIEEFALRRAVGTPRILLAGIVLAETLLTGLLTAAAAIGVGMFGLRVVSALFAAREPVLAEIAFPWQAGVAGVVAGLAAGVLGGFVPALRAARIPIANVMRA